MMSTPASTHPPVPIPPTASAPPAEGPRDALVLEGVRKRYDETVALKGISLRVAPGEIHGLIGPDGAGKTTLMRIVCGLLLPDEGSVRVLGFDGLRDARRIKEELGYMPQRFSLYPDLTVGENLRFFADLYQVSGAERTRREEQLFAFSGLGPFRTRRAGQLSGGMRQKLALSCVLIHRPLLLVLDEPTTGVDVVSRKEFWGILTGLAREGVAMLVSTPYMDEAERFDRLALMHHGRVIADGNPEGVRRRFQGRLFEVAGHDLDVAWRRLRGPQRPGIQVHRFGDRLHVLLEASVAADVLAEPLHALAVESHEIEPSVEDAFVALVGAGD
ncbi:MAG: ABC transporter ATP-binding protein [Candidatus Eisenbacteria bacterium]